MKMFGLILAAIVVIYAICLWAGLIRLPYELPEQNAQPVSAQDANQPEQNKPEDIHTDIVIGLLFISSILFTAGKIIGNLKTLFLGIISFIAAVLIDYKMVIVVLLLYYVIIPTFVVGGILMLFKRNE
jgi:hypothetical protein